MTEEQINKLLEEYQLVYLDDVPLDDPKPSAYKFGYYEQDLDSGRDITGVMDRNVLEHHPRKLFLSFPYGMNIEQMSKLLKQLNKSTLNVRAFSPEEGKITDTAMKLMHGDLEPEVDFFFFDYDTQKIDCKYLAFSVELVEY